MGSDPTETGEERTSLPDLNTSEAILYGPAYSWVKNAMWVWDEIEEYLLRKADSLESQIMDRQWAYEVLRNNRYLIFARSPPVNDVRRLKDLFTLASLVKVTAALRKIDEYRRQNRAWARMKGIQGYVDGLKGKGISEYEWKAATAAHNMEPITYDYVHGLDPGMLPGEVFDLAEAMRDVMGAEEYDSLMGRLFGSDEEDGGESDGCPEEAEEETDGVVQEADGEDSPWAGDALSRILEAMFPDPVRGCVDMLEGESDLLARAAGFWEAMDSDDVSLVDGMTRFAEAAL